GAEEGPVPVERVGPDAVTQQGAAALAPGRVDRDDRDPELVLLVHAEAAYELVGERGLAGAAGAGDAQDGHLAPGCRLADLGQRSLVEPAGLDAGDGAGDGEAVTGEDLVDGDRAVLPEVEVAVGDDGVDHPH